MDKYGLSSLPDHFNPYYLRMCGLSTLDLPIPLYLYDEEGNQLLNEDAGYRALTDTDAPLTQLILIRMDELDNNGSEIHEIGNKANETVTQINANLAISYLKYIGFYDANVKEVNDRIFVWRLDISKEKVAALKSYMENTDFTPNDDKSTVVNIITGEYDWEDLAYNSPVFEDALRTVSDKDVPFIQNPIANQYVHCTSVRKTFKFNASRNLWERVNVEAMLDETIRHFRRQNVPTDASVSFIKSYTAPKIEALVVIGNLNWDKMYDSGNYSVMNSYETVTDIEFSELTTTLGYSDSDLPPVGLRVNFHRNARCWVNEENENDVIYTKNILPKSGDNVYTSPYLNNDDVLMHSSQNVPIRVADIEQSSALTFIALEDGRVFKRNVGHNKLDVALMHKTLEFNGIEWVEVSERKLFEDQLKTQIEETIGYVSGFTYTTMATPFDKESFDEKLIIDKNANLCIDRVAYSGWDRPVYVPSHDYKNELTKDFTLYTRFWNHMRDAHVRTALKYHVASTEYAEVLEKYPDYMDYIKGVCYPVTNCLDQLNWHYEIGSNGTQIRVAYKDEYDAWLGKIKDAIAKIAEEKNYTLLQYDSTLLKENEAESILSRIKQTLSCVRERWDVKEFGYEELYYAAVWSALWAHLPLTILAQRIKNLRTEAVHINHIWEYLASHGLKDYRTVMDTEQQVFLYKNIKYLIGNEGKQKTLEILSDKLLGVFNAEVRTKSVLLDTTKMLNNSIGVSINGEPQQYHHINGLTESVSGEVKLLSEDLNNKTTVTSDLDGRIEDYDDVFYREYLSGLVPEYGDNTDEQREHIAETHDEIEISKHTYAPTKLVEITRGEMTSDLTRISVAFIFQSLMRMLSSQSDIGSGCVINAIFYGLSNPKTFTVGEVIALIFYAMRKQDWYTYYNKYGNQRTNKNDLWKDIVSIEEAGSLKEEVPITESERVLRINQLTSYANCEQEPVIDDDGNIIESQCNHEFYDSDEVFNDTIPQRTTVWLPYLGNYFRWTENGTVEVNVSLPETETGLKTLIGNPIITVSSRTINRNAAQRYLMQIVSPYEYSSLDIASWNTMCVAEEAGTVPAKYDACIGGYRTEQLTFNQVVGSGTAAASSVGGIVDGSSRSKQDKYYFDGIPYTDEAVNSHDTLITLLSDQANAMVRHFLMVRNSSDAYFHNAMEKIYDSITIKDELYLDLVPGYKTYSEWFDSDIELKSVFRSIEEGSDQETIYASIVDNLVAALFPANKITVSGNVDQTKYAAMKELFQWMGSYNIAYLNTSSVQYESLYLHPITITPRNINGSNNRYILTNNDYNWCSIVTNTWIQESWTTTQFLPFTFTETWETLFSRWSFTATEENGNELIRSGICKTPWKKDHRSSWTSVTKFITDSPESLARFDVDFKDPGNTVVYLEATGEKGVDVDEATAILLYGSVEEARNIPHFKSKYKTYKTTN